MVSNWLTLLTLNNGCNHLLLYPVVVSQDEPVSVGMTMTRHKFSFLETLNTILQ